MTQRRSGSPSAFTTHSVRDKTSSRRYNIGATRSYCERHFRAPDPDLEEETEAVVETRRPRSPRPVSRIDAERRREYRDKIIRALTDQLDRLSEDRKISPGVLAQTLRIQPIPDQAPMLLEAIATRLVDDENSIPPLIKLIREFAKKKAHATVTILEDCLDLILPYHFSPEAVKIARSRFNATGGGLLMGTLTTNCGAEHVMAAFDESEARFDPKDRNLPGIHAKGRGLPPLGKMSIDDDATAFLGSVFKMGSKEFRARKLDSYKTITNRSLYCIVEMPKDQVEQSYVSKLLKRASELQPDLPIFLLTSDGQFKDEEEFYRSTLELRFFRDDESHGEQG